MSFYLENDEELIFIPYSLLAIDFEFITTKVIENKAKKYIQEIVEVGLVYRNENILEKYSEIVRPRCFIESKNKSQSVYGSKFTYEKIEKGIDFKDVLKKIKEVYSPRETVWMSWGKAEYDILKNICRRYNLNIPFLKEDHLDLSLEFSEFYKINQKLSLDKVLNLLNIPIVNRHNALPDAKVLMEIVYKMFIDGYKLESKIKNI